MYLGGSGYYLIIFDEQNKNVSQNELWISDFSLAFESDTEINSELVNTLCEPALLKTWLGELDNDRFNHLLLKANLTWNDILVLRAYAKYLRQLSFAFNWY